MSEKKKKNNHNSERNMLLMLKRTVRIDGKRYLRLVCIDVERGVIVLLADNNGRPAEGLHSWNTDIASVKEMQVIRAEYEKYEPMNEACSEVQLFRSRFEIVGQGADMMEYYKKLYAIQARYIIDRKIEVFENELYGRAGSKFYKARSPWIIVMSLEEAAGKIIGGQKCINLLGANCEYALMILQNDLLTDRELAIWNAKVKIADERLATSELAGKYYNGLALLSIYSKPGSSRAEASVERLYGSFSDKVLDSESRLEGHDILEAYIDGIKFPDIGKLREEFVIRYNDDTYTFDEVDDLAFVNDPNWGTYLDEEHIIDEMDRTREAEENSKAAEAYFKVELEEGLENLETVRELYDEYESEDPAENDFATNYSITYYADE